MANYDILVTDAAKFLGNLSIRQRKICEAVAKICAIEFESNPQNLTADAVNSHIQKSVQNLPVSAGLERHAVNAAIWRAWANGSAAGITTATIANMLKGGKLFQGMSEQQIDDLNIWLTGEALAVLT